MLAQVAYCTNSTNGARPIPAGTFTSVHWVQTPDFVQLTAMGDFTKLNVKPRDQGGELDPHGGPYPQPGDV